MDIPIIPPSIILFVILKQTSNSDKFCVVNNEPLRFLGRISYSMYLVHFPIMRDLMDSSLFNETSSYSSIWFKYVVFFCVALLCTITISILIYYSVERPGMKMGKLIVEWLEKRKQTNRNIFDLG